MFDKKKRNGAHSNEFRDVFVFCSYRISNAVNLAAEEFIVSKQNVIGHASIREAVQMHWRTIKLVKLV